MAIQKSALKREAKKRGLVARGDFMFAQRTEDIISGLVLDAAPAYTYIWTFILPAFDQLKFLHMTLGRRIATCAGEADCLARGIDTFKSELLDVKNAGDLIEYIGRWGVTGEYAIWAKYICLVRLGKTRQAESYISRAESRLGSPEILRKIDEVRIAEAKGGVASVKSLLDEWSAFSERLFIGIPENYKFSGCSF